MEPTNEKIHLIIQIIVFPLWIFKDEAWYKFLTMPPHFVASHFFFGENLSKGDTKKGLATGPLEKKVPNYKNFA